MVAVDGVSVVGAEITLEDAKAAGYASVAELLEDLQGPADSTLYRLELRATSEADARQPTIRRAKTSMTNATYTNPRQVATYVKSDTQS